MRTLFLVAFFLLSNTLVRAQQSVTIKVGNLSKHVQKGEAIYLAGSFNNWNPASETYRLKEEENGSYSILLQLQKGSYEFKLTRGSWQKGESGAGGQALENRRLEVVGDTVVQLTVQQWADEFQQPKKTSTASKNISIIDTAFYIPQLNRHRRIWIYLPDGYATSRKKYPVLYLHDGQNVFEDSTSFSGEWGVDEALDSAKKSSVQAIVVAVDNGGTTRINEYSPYQMEQYGKGEGDAYVDFLVHTLRPYINSHYRTKKCSKHNYVAGSSMGGLISFYAVLKYPKKWGGAGVFSPAFWIVPQLTDAVAAKAKKVKSKLYFYAGQQESKTMVPDMLQVFGLMNKHSRAKMKSVIRAGAAHNESAWRKEFPAFYHWMMK